MVRNDKLAHGFFTSPFLDRMRHQTNGPGDYEESLSQPPVKTHVADDRGNRPIDIQR